MTELTTQPSYHEAAPRAPALPARGERPGAGAAIPRYTPAVSRRDAAERLRALIEAAEAGALDPTSMRDEGEALAQEVAGDLGFRWRVLALRALLPRPPQDDTVAERYGELVELARGEEARLATLRELGAAIRALQDAGELPRTMLARLPRRR